MFNTGTKRHGKFEWLPTVLAAAAFVGFVAAFGYELVSYQKKAVEWANGDINNNLNYTGFTHQVIALLDAED